METQRNHSVNRVAHNKFLEEKRKIEKFTALSMCSCISGLIYSSCVNSVPALVFSVGAFTASIGYASKRTYTNEWVNNQQNYLGGFNFWHHVAWFCKEQKPHTLEPK